ncbi:MAG: universal stress protein [Gemmatimonadetes bacterium]|nr:universal stress protein [Gemmatimonadota bacterium]
MAARILVASDGSPASLGALRMARAFSDRKAGTRVLVVSALEPLAVYDAGLGTTVGIDVEVASRDSRMEHVEKQVRDIAGPNHDWKVEVVYGVPPRAIARHALEWKADWIFLGLGKHGPVERIFGSETALHVIRASHVPVFAAAPELKELPRRALVAVDFSPFSEAAMKLAPELLAPGGELHLVHVITGIERDTPIAERWLLECRTKALEGLERLADEVTARAGAPAVKLQVRTGEPGDEIMALGGEIGADLVTAGSHGRSFIGRLFLGSVSTRLLRKTQASMLVVPPATVAAELVPMAEAAAGGIPREEWSGWLTEFTNRNFARATALEVDDADIGVQEIERDYLLLGAAYDHRDDRINIMLGEPGSSDVHLTQTVEHPEAVEILAEESGKDAVLRVGNRRGQTLLKFVTA